MDLMEKSGSLISGVNGGSTSVFGISLQEKKHKAKAKKKKNQNRTKAFFE
jgi:hypothetical protein